MITTFNACSGSLAFQDNSRVAAALPREFKQTYTDGSQLISVGHSATLSKSRLLSMYEACPQSKFSTRPTASKPYIARSDCAYVIEQ
jgi:hypothetical protein